MPTQRRSDDNMTFEEFKRRMAAVPFEFADIVKEFSDFLRSGCSEAEARRWLALHFWEFHERLPNTIVSGFGEEALQKAAEQRAPLMTQEQKEPRFKKIWTRDGFQAARGWLERQEKV